MSNSEAGVGGPRVLASTWDESAGLDGSHNRAGDPPGPRRPARRVVHVDVKKLGWISDGGVWRIHCRAEVTHSRNHSRVVAEIHSAIDVLTRLAYSGIHDDEKGPTCAGFWVRARGFFDRCGITRIDAVLTDNAKNYTGIDFSAPLDGVEHRRTRHYQQSKQAA